MNLQYSIFLFTAALALSSCASTGSGASTSRSLDVLERMEGGQSATALSVLGQPTDIAQKDGNTLYKWRNEQGVMNEDSEFIRESAAFSCSVEIVADESDIIRDTQMKGDLAACRGFISKLNAYGENNHD